jgi:spore maturation protein CgeB
MRIVYFCHSLVSDWNHGNAHFLRGLATELGRRGHTMRIFEPEDGWSLGNLRRRHGDAPLRAFHKAYPRLQSRFYPSGGPDLDEALAGADVVIAHEWNEPELIERLGRHRASAGGFRLLFHDRRHRSATAPAEMARFDLREFDGALVFGESIARIYRKRRWAKRVWTLHEAADTRVFAPRPGAMAEADLVWVGNWGDDERTAELEEFLLRPVKDLGLRANAWGVRYPERAVRVLRKVGINYHGWLPNFLVPEVYSRHALTLHIPRRPYARALPGIPTIRVFEALACAMPLICSPWQDTELLFGADDFLIGHDGPEMTRLIRRALQAPEDGRQRALAARRTILQRHTCAHRADELLQICREIELPAAARSANAPREAVA